MHDEDHRFTPAVAAVDAQTHAPELALDDGAPRHRASLVLLFNSRREVLLRRAHVPGVPHGGGWRCAIEEEVPHGSSYAHAATWALRDALGARLVPTLRFVGKTWLDEGGGRAFLGVFVAAHDGPVADARATFVPMQDLVRDLRRHPRALDDALARALRLVMGEDAPVA